MNSKAKYSTAALEAKTQRVWNFEAKSTRLEFEASLYMVVTFSDTT